MNDPNQPGNPWGQSPSGGPYPQAQAPQPQQPRFSFADAKAAGYRPTEEEMTQAFYAHLFAAIASIVFCGFAVPIAAPLIVLATAKQKTPFLLFHINQSFMFQAVVFGVNVALGVLFTMMCFGLGGILYLLNGVPPIIGAVMALIVGMSAKNGEWREYPVVGAKVLNSANPLFK